MPQSPSRPRIGALDHLVLTVRDIEATLRFYTEVLGMEENRFETTDGTSRWAVTFGRQKINLHEKGREFSPRAAQPQPGSADLCFLTDTSLEDWTRHLAACGVTIEDGPVRRTGATGPILSIYVRDPDDNLIEIARPAS